jgi:S-adenosylmethionine:tRNA ribosyltransferase-isomerase
MRVDELDYCLPPRAIAQEPAEPRDSARLLEVRLPGGALADRQFSELPQLLNEGDLLVVNDARVSARRLRGRLPTGGAVEVLVTKKRDDEYYDALVRPSKKLIEGRTFNLENTIAATVVERRGEGLCVLKLDFGGAEPDLAAVGTTPLPPYFCGKLLCDDRYQTVYSRADGSSAAPTAGLHFTHCVLDALRRRGVGIACVTLNVGIDTFRPMTADQTSDHKMHGEEYEIPVATADAISSARGRIFAVGTTCVRALESAATEARRVRVGTGSTRLFIEPGFRFQIVDGLLTNFHMPRTTMLMMVAALSSVSVLRDAYHHALAAGYRFLSFGDCMLLTPEVTEK